MRTIGAGIVFALSLLTVDAMAGALTIIGFEGGGGIQFQGGTVSNFYTLEFASSLDGSWTNWGSVTEQAITGTVMGTAFPMFFRIKETDSSQFPPYAPMQHTHVVPSEWMTTGAVHSEQIASGAVTAVSIAPGAITSASLASNTITAANMAEGIGLLPASAIVLSETPTSP